MVVSEKFENEEYQQTPLTGRVFNPYKPKDNDYKLTDAKGYCLLRVILLHAYFAFFLPSSCAIKTL